MSSQIRQTPRLCSPYLKPILMTVVADAGYRSEENLLRLDKKQVNHLIKYTMFDKEQKRGYKQSARNLANWHYDDKEDSYTHPDG